MNNLNVEKEMWKYYQSHDSELDSFCEVLQEVTDSGYCLDPGCNCSGACLWKNRGEEEDDGLAPDIKEQLRSMFLKLRGKRLVEEVSLMCPICRTSNRYSLDQKKIMGSEDKCSVCLESQVEVYLPMCGHSCLCQKCAARLSS
jgi:hypothetical protein